MATTGSFDLNLTALGRTTNNSVGIAESIMFELQNQSSLIGLGIAISIALALIFGAIFLVINFIPRLIGKVKGIRGGV